MEITCQEFLSWWNSMQDQHRQKQRCAFISRDAECQCGTKRAAVLCVVSSLRGYYSTYIPLTKISSLFCCMYCVSIGNKTGNSSTDARDYSDNRTYDRAANKETEMAKNQHRSSPDTPCQLFH